MTRKLVIRMRAPCSEVVEEKKVELHQNGKFGFIVHKHAGWKEAWEAQNKICNCTSKTAKAFGGWTVIPMLEGTEFEVWEET